MSKPRFQELVEKGDEDSLKQAHEILWAMERGRSTEPLFDDSGPIPKVNIDWDELQEIALRKTFFEWIREVITPLPSWFVLSTTFLIGALPAVAVYQYIDFWPLSIGSKLTYITFMFTASSIMFLSIVTGFRIFLSKIGR